MATQQMLGRTRSVGVAVQLPQLPEQFEFLKPFVFASTGQPGLREMGVLMDAGIEDDDEDRYTASHALMMFTLYRRTGVKPQPFADAWADEHFESEGYVAVTFLTSERRGGVKVKPVTTHHYQVKGGRANKRRSTKPRGRLLATIDIRRIQLAKSDEPSILEVA